ncbi:MAG: hypothetical protein ACPLRU_06415, partial [Desulfofundulus sp.]
MAVITKPRAYDIPLSIDLYRQANDKGLTLSQYLEMIDPSSEYGPNEKLDAFERQIKRVNEQFASLGKPPLVLKSIPEKGIWASKIEAFYTTNESAVLFPEFINRVAREALMADDILNELVAVRTPIDSNAYRTVYVVNEPAKASKRRVSEGADMPVAEMRTSENTIKIYKYGRRLRATYEAIRRMRIDLFRLHVEAIMRQASVDRAADAYNVLLNGDGNDNAATAYSLTDLKSGATSLDYGVWTSFLFKFYPYKMTRLIGGANELVTFLTMQAPNVDPIRLIEQLNFGRATSQGEMAQSIFNNYRIVYLPTAASNKLLGIDNRYALEMVVEIGSDIQETQRIISSQWEELVISEVNGFGIILPEARRV